MQFDILLQVVIIIIWICQKSYKGAQNDLTYITSLAQFKTNPNQIRHA